MRSYTIWGLIALAVVTATFFYLGLSPVAPTSTGITHIPRDFPIDSGEADLNRTPIVGVDESKVISVLSPSAPEGERTPEFIRLAGHVRDGDGRALNRGIVFVQHPLRHNQGYPSDIRAPISESGEFEFLLPSSLYLYGYAAVRVHDGNVYIYRGLVPIREDLQLFVVSSRLREDRLEGLVAVPGAKADDEWFVVLTATSGALRGRGLADSSGFGNSRGPSGMISLVAAPWLATHDGSVALSVMFANGHYLGYEQFSSLSVLREALASGVTIESASQILDVERINGQDITFLEFRPFHGVATFFPVERLEGHRFLVRLPPGSLSTKAYNERGDYGLARLDVGNESELSVQWEYVIPAEATLRILVTNSGGEPVVGGHVHYEKTEIQAPSLLSGRVNTEGNGTSVIKGLPEGHYVVRYEAPDGREVTEAKVHVSAHEEQTVELQLGEPRGAVFVVAENAWGLGINTIDENSSQLWWRQGRSTQWTRLDSQELGENGWVVSGLEVGQRYEFAMRGDWWGGEAECTVAGTLTAVSLRIRPLKPLRVTLESVSESQDGRGNSYEVVWSPFDFVGDSSASILPWHTAHGPESVELLGDFASGYLHVFQQGVHLKSVSVAESREGDIRVTLE